jgi:hypothetical protein
MHFVVAFVSASPEFQHLKMCWKIKELLAIRAGISRNIQNAVIDFSLQMAAMSCLEVEALRSLKAVTSGFIQIYSSWF